MFTVTADHDWDEGETTKEPDCDDEGEMAYERRTNKKKI